MRAFVVLCLVALASADQLGYNYHSVDHSYTPGGVSEGSSYGVASNVGPAYAAVSSVPSVAAAGDAYNVGSSFAGVSSGPSLAVVGDASNADSSIAGASSGASFAAFGGASSDGNSFAAIGSGPAVGQSFDAVASGPSFSATSSGPSFVSTGAVPDFAVSQGGFEAASNAAPVAAGGIEKEYYTFTADEQDFAEPAATNQIANSLKQGIRVIFIKGPESSGVENAALAVAKQVSDQKTDIYVLTKQADVSELANKLETENRNANNKPEVHFVKYRTQEDAVHAQHAIQAEYDALGGPTQHIDGGVAPSLNFASQAPVAATGHRGSAGAGSGTAGVTVGNVGSTYLPASVLRLFRL